MRSKWKLLGYDTFSNEWYPLSEHKNQELAEKAAAKRMDGLEVSQPANQSGGQGLFGIQDRIFIERPDGFKYRWLASSRALDASKKGSK
jgi:hypothetical protein